MGGSITFIFVYGGLIGLINLYLRKVDVLYTNVSFRYSLKAESKHEPLKIVSIDAPLS